MGIVKEQISCEIVQAELSIVERDGEEAYEPWRFITLELDGFESMTPVELRKFGRWCINEGKRIGREYKSNGASK